VDDTTMGGFKTIDWDDSSDRKWLMSHLHWAMRNGRRVTLQPFAESFTIVRREARHG
jgi:hypothetical protein